MPKVWLVSVWNRRAVFRIPVKTKDDTTIHQWNGSHRGWQRHGHPLTPAQRRKRLERDKAANVEVILNKTDDPKLTAGALDRVLIVNAYHEMEAYETMLGHVREALKSGGRLVIVDNMPGRTRSQPRAIQVKNHAIDPEFILADLRKAGFQLETRNDDLDGNPAMDQVRWMIIARPPTPSPNDRALHDQRILPPTVLSLLGVDNWLPLPRSKPDADGHVRERACSPHKDTCEL